MAKKGITKYNLIGQRFGKLVVVEFLGLEHGNSMWKCVCDCGKETKTRSQNLITGKTKSCRCIDIERKRKLALRLKKSNIKNPKRVAETHIFDIYRKDAKKRKLEFQLDKDDLPSLIYKNCFYCGCPPQNSQTVFRRDKNVVVSYNGIDRINSSKGYTLDNVVPCCKTCNFAKNNLTTDEFVLWIKRIYRNFVLPQVKR